MFIIKAARASLLSLTVVTDCARATKKLNDRVTVVKIMFCVLLIFGDQSDIRSVIIQKDEELTMLSDGI